MSSDKRFNIRASSRLHEPSATAGPSTDVEPLSPFHGQGLLQLIQAAQAQAQQADCVAEYGIGVKVWAKVRGWCLWPGVIWCIDLIRKKDQPELLRSFQPGSQLVHFYGEHNAAWVQPSCLLRATVEQRGTINDTDKCPEQTLDATLDLGRLEEVAAVRSSDPACRASGQQGEAADGTEPPSCVSGTSAEQESRQEAADIADPTATEPEQGSSKQHLTYDKCVSELRQWAKRVGRVKQVGAAIYEMETCLEEGPAEVCRLMRLSEVWRDASFTPSVVCACCGEDGAQVQCSACSRAAHPLCLDPPSLDLSCMPPNTLWTCPKCAASNVVAACSLNVPRAPKKRGRKRKSELAGNTAADGKAGDEAADAHSVADKERLGLTPDWIIQTVCYHVFQLKRPSPGNPCIKGLLDPASNSQLYPNIPAEVLFSSADNGLKLTCSWSGFYILLNPPYQSQIQWRFVNRAIDEVENGNVPAILLLCRNSTDSAYFQRLRPYPRVHLKRNSAHFKDYDRTTPGFGIAAILIATPDKQDLYLRFLSGFSHAGEASLPIDATFMRSTAFLELCCRLRLESQHQQRDHWVQCTSCGKWRVIAYHTMLEIQEAEHKEGLHWTCALLRPPYSSCRTALSRAEQLGLNYMQAGPEARVDQEELLEMGNWDMPINISDSAVQAKKAIKAGAKADSAHVCQNPQAAATLGAGGKAGTQGSAKVQVTGSRKSARLRHGTHAPCGASTVAAAEDGTVPAGCNPGGGSRLAGATPPAISQIADDSCADQQMVDVHTHSSGNLLATADDGLLAAGEATHVPADWMSGGLSREAGPPAHVLANGLSDMDTLPSLHLNLGHTSVSILEPESMFAIGSEDECHLLCHLPSQDSLTLALMQDTQPNATALDTRMEVDIAARAQTAQGLTMQEAGLPCYQKPSVALGIADQPIVTVKEQHAEATPEANADAMLVSVGSSERPSSASLIPMVSVPLDGRPAAATATPAWFIERPPLVPPSLSDGHDVQKLPSQRVAVPSQAKAAGQQHKGVSKLVGSATSARPKPAVAVDAVAVPGTGSTRTRQVRLPHRLVDDPSANSGRGLASTAGRKAASKPSPHTSTKVQAQDITGQLASLLKSRKAPGGPAATVELGPTPRKARPQKPAADSSSHPKVAAVPAGTNAARPLADQAEQAAAARASKLRLRLQKPWGNPSVPLIGRKGRKCPTMADMAGCGSAATALAINIPSSTPSQQLDAVGIQGSQHLDEGPQKELVSCLMSTLESAKQLMDILSDRLTGLTLSESSTAISMRPAIVMVPALEGVLTRVEPVCDHQAAPAQSLEAVPGELITTMKSLHTKLDQAVGLLADCICE